MLKLANKVAFITGAGRGIGRAIALKLAQEGARLVINDMDNEPAHSVVKEIVRAGGEAIAVVGNVNEVSFPSRFIDSGLDAFGGIDIIVNNAGYTWDSLIQNMSDEQFDAMMDVHVKAPFRILRAASAFIREQAQRETNSGQEIFRKVVNITSISGTGGNIGQVNYSSAKAGVIGLTKAMAKEWGRFKVNVNCVGFGIIETRLSEISDEKKTICVDGKEIAVGIPTKVSTVMRSMIPLGRLGTAEEAANGVYLFCSPESNYISGQTILVAGGASI